MVEEARLARAIEEYGDTVQRICLVHLKNQQDTQDIFQTVFLKYTLRREPFHSPAHEKAWIIQVTLNACRELLKSFFRSRTQPLEGLPEPADPGAGVYSPVLEAVLALPQKYRDVIYLHYYEGYSAPEIGVILRKNTNTVYTLLARARDRLKQELGGEDDGR